MCITTSVHRLLAAAGVAAAVTLVSGTASAQNTTFTYQGVLEDGGSPVDGSTVIDFRLFDTETGGTQVGSTITEIASVDDGVFSADLDFGVSSFAANQDLWLEIQIGVDVFPRQRLNATPFALNTRGIDVDAAGVVSPSAANFSMGKVDTGDGIYNFLDDSTGSVVGNYVRFLGNNDTELSALGFLRFQVGFDEQMLIRPDFTLINNELHTMERVGIGTTNPARRLHLRGADGFMLVERDSNPAGVILRTFDDDTYTTETSEWRMLSGNDGNFQLQNANNGFTLPFVVTPTDRVGFIAQDVEAVIPDWIDEGEDGFKRMTIRGFEALAVEAIREQQELIVALEAQSEAMQSQRSVVGASAWLPLAVDGVAISGIAALLRRRQTKA